MLYTIEVNSQHYVILKKIINTQTFEYIIRFILMNRDTIYYSNETLIDLLSYEIIIDNLIGLEKLLNGLSDDLLILTNNLNVVGVESFIGNRLILILGA